MNVIKINIDGKRATNPDTTQKIVCGNTDYVVAFTFSPEWDAHEVKTARFVTGATFTEEVFTGNECPAPKLSNVAGVEIGVYAGDLETTTRAYVDCEKSILCGGGVHAEPPKDVYIQLAAMCDEAVQTANAVEQRADNGEFNGEKGDKGDKGDKPVKGVDYYTAADKKAIVNDTVKAIPKAYNGSGQYGLIKLGSNAKGIDLTADDELILKQATLANLENNSTQLVVTKPSLHKHVIALGTHQQMNDTYKVNTISVPSSFDGRQAELPASYAAVKAYIDAKFAELLKKIEELQA